MLALWINDHLAKFSAGVITTGVRTYQEKLVKVIKLAGVSEDMYCDIAKAFVHPNDREACIIALVGIAFLQRTRIDQAASVRHDTDNMPLVIEGILNEIKNQLYSDVVENLAERPGEKELYDYPWTQQVDQADMSANTAGVVGTKRSAVNTASAAGTGRPTSSAMNAERGAAPRPRGAGAPPANTEPAGARAYRR